MIATVSAGGLRRFDGLALLRQPMTLVRSLCQLLEAVEARKDAHEVRTRLVNQHRVVDPVLVLVLVLEQVVERGERVRVVALSKQPCDTLQHLFELSVQAGHPLGCGAVVGCPTPYPMIPESAGGER
jgi:hypothetical protein